MKPNISYITLHIADQIDFFNDNLFFSLNLQIYILKLNYTCACAVYVTGIL